MERQLKTFRTIEGKSYRLLKLLIPQPIYYQGECLPAIYVNFVITNGVVIVLAYQQDELDEQAFDIIRTAFLHRDIIPIDATTVIKQHGPLHCLTMQQIPTSNIEL